MEGNQIMVSQAEELPVKIPKSILNKIILGDSRNMNEIPDNSVHLIVTSPPYNVGKDYEKEQLLVDWIDLMEQVLSECKRVVVSGGRIAINVANINRKPYVPLHYYIIEIMLGLGFLMRGEIIWLKRESAGKSTAWGSWKSASNPCLRDEHEYILIFSKDQYRLKKETEENSNTISASNFVSYTRSIWDNIKTESAKRIGHPTPFPIKIPIRLIELYSFKNNIVLDPFIGSGTTAIASLLKERYFIGYEMEPKYVDLANKRIYPYLNQKKITKFTS